MAPVPRGHLAPQRIRQPAHRPANLDRHRAPAGRDGDDVGDLVAVPPRDAYVQTSRERERWRAFARAVLAATQDAPSSAGATEDVPSPAAPSPAGATLDAPFPAGATAGTTTA
jgi:hypothetical protein